MDQPNRLERAWICLRCKPALEFYSRQEWVDHYKNFHTEKLAPKITQSNQE